MKRICLPLFPVLLTVLLALSACVDEVEQIVYEYEPAKTEFAFVLPKDNVTKNGRMTEGVVNPTTQSFTMEGIHLFPFQLGGKAGERKLTTEMTIQGENVLTMAHVVGKDDRQHGAAWFDNVTVPYQTNYFLMYGHQSDVTTPANDLFNLEDIEDKNHKKGFQNGSTRTPLYNPDENVTTLYPLSNLTFGPDPIFTPNYFRVSNGPVPTYAPNHDYLVRRQWVLTFLKGVLQSNKDGVYWYDIANLEMQQLYQEFVNVSGGGKIISASSKTILAMMQQLYGDLNTIKTNLGAKDPKTEEDNKALALINAMLADNGPIFKSITVEGNTFNIVKPTAPETALAFGNDPQFPIGVDLPDGALQLHLIPNPGAAASVEFVHELNGDEIEKIYAYPAQLYYTDRSEIGVSAEKTKEKFTDGVKWDDFVNENYATDYVFLFAQSLVLKSPVKFAMANLSTKVSFGNQGIKDSRDKTVTVPPLNYSTFLAKNDEEKKTLLHQYITLTGILVSDQREVGWDFTRESASADAPAYMIYDKMLNAYDANIDATPQNAYRSKAFLTRDPVAKVIANHTLVYPSKVLQANDNDRIFVILEFENGDQEFHGVNDCLIQPHTRFYISYRMDAHDLKLVAGNQLFAPAERVDLQLTITGLSGAYNVMPDVRMIKMNLGVAAKIKWENGMTFDDIPVQGN